MSFPPLSVRDITRTALLSAILFAVQIALAPLPNIELVSVLVITFTLHFKRLALYAVYVFAVLEGIVFGFGIWWVSYLYVWTILYALSYLFRKTESPLFWAFLNGAFGLCFGALTALPYFFAGGPGAALTYFLAGIPFDITHCAGNFASALLLCVPLRKLLKRLSKYL